MGLNFKILGSCLALISWNCFGDGTSQRFLSQQKSFSEYGLNLAERSIKNPDNKATSENYIKEINELKKRVKQYDAMIENYVEEINKLKERVKHFREKCEKYKKEIDELKKRVREQQSEITKHLEYYSTLSEVNSSLNDKVEKHKEQKYLSLPSWFEYVELDDSSEIKRSIKHGIDVNSRNSKGDTALILAIENGYTDLVKLLLDQKTIDVNLSNKGRTPLTAAIIKGNIDILTNLLEKGANVEKESLFMAVDLDNTKIVELLLKHYNGDDRKQVIKKLINSATNDGSEEMVNLLTKEGAYVNKGDEDGVTPLMRAADSGEIKIVKQLIEKKSEINRRDRNGLTPLMYAVKSSMGTEKIVQLLASVLLSENEDINVKDKDGCTALMHAVNAPNCLSKVEILLKVGANLNLVNNEGKTALNIAEENMRKSEDHEKKEEFSKVVKMLQRAKTNKI